MATPAGLSPVVTSCEHLAGCRCRPARRSRPSGWRSSSRVPSAESARAIGERCGSALVGPVGRRGRDGSARRAWSRRSEGSRWRAGRRPGSPGQRRVSIGRPCMLIEHAPGGQASAAEPRRAGRRSRVSVSTAGRLTSGRRHRFQAGRARISRSGPSGRRAPAGCRAARPTRP